MELSAEALRQVADLYSQGKYLAALEAAQPFGELKSWESTDGRLMAGRLAANLGAPQLSGVAHLLAYRNEPEHPLAVYYYALQMNRRRDPWTTLTIMRRFGELSDASEQIRADWLALHGRVFSQLRDFETADDYFKKAEALAPDRPWIWVERSSMLAAEDLFDKSLEAAQRSLELQPWFRPGVQATASALVQLNRDQEAVTLLTRAGGEIEAGNVMLQLAMLQTELQQYNEARQTLENVERFLPLMEKHFARWLFARQSDAAYYCYDFSAAAELAQKVVELSQEVRLAIKPELLSKGAFASERFYADLAERLSADPVEGDRVLLNVGFVRQHRQTCAPATLSAISGYWDKKAEHLEVADEICFDGTPWHSQRRWAEANGWVTREFTLTWETAVTLLDRGVPFALTTVWVRAAHLQAVMGYDSRRQTLLIREPGDRVFNEFPRDKLLEDFKSTGPRAMVMVPQGAEEKLEGVEFVDSELYDLLYKMDMALNDHDRAGAGHFHDEMHSAAPDHRLTHHARLMLGYYDTDVVAIVEANNALLELFPDDGNFQMTAISCLRELGRRDERLEQFEAICAKDDADAIFLQQYAAELIDDARSHDKAEWLLRRSLLRRPSEGATYSMLADILWEEHRREESLELERFAACLEDLDHGYDFPRIYFFSARQLGQTETALRFLKDRFERFGHLSSWPARTLALAYDALDRAADAMEVLEAAITQHPDDGELMLYVADQCARYGDRDRADELLSQARVHSHKRYWLRTGARMAAYRGDLQTALDKWMEVLKEEPLARDANAHAARLLAETEGPKEAISFLRGAIKRFPNNYPLRAMLIEWLLGEDPEAAEQATRELLEIQSGDPWGHRMLARLLAEQNKLEEAAEEAEVAIQLEPSNAFAVFIRGEVALLSGDTERAKEAFRQALQMSVDCQPAIAGLMDCCDSKAERIEALQFVRDLLLEQHTLGDSLFAFCHFAAGTMEDEELLEVIETMRRQRPDLPQAWAANVRQLGMMGRLDDALEVANDAVDEFPLVEELWYEQARVHHSLDKVEAEIDSLERALEINPASGSAARALADALERTGKTEQARQVMEQAVAREPDDPNNHAFLAEILWQAEDLKGALEHMQMALRLAPDFEAAWRRLQEWSMEMDDPHLAVDLAREFTRSRPNNAQVWIVLSALLREPRQWPEALSALDKALKADPRNVEAHYRRASLLAAMDQFEEALAACRPPAFGDKPPLELRARAASIEAQRGNIDAAIKQMKSVTEEEPDYPEAWYYLAEWYDHSDRKPEYLEAAQHMARLAPQDPMSWGCLGDARLRNGDRDGAKEAFQRASEIAPDYEFASQNLFEMQMEDGQHDEAEQTIRRISEFLPTGYESALHVRIAAARQDEDAAKQHLGRLCKSEFEHTDPLRMALDAMLQQGWGESIDQTLGKYVTQEGANPGLGGIWIEWCAKCGLWDRCKASLDMFRPRGDIWFVACESYLFELGEAKHESELNEYLQHNTRLLRDDPRTWSSAGKALADVGKAKECVDWLSDWKQREDVEPYMLVALVNALWQTDQAEEASKVAQHAIQLESDDRTKYLHALWLALHHSLEGDGENAAGWLGPMTPDGFSNGFYATLCAMTFALVAIQNTDQPELNYNTAKQHFTEALAPFLAQVEEDKLLQKIFYRCLWRLAKDFGLNLTAAWWKLRAGMV